jgi:hypothetical protein
MVKSAIRWDARSDGANVTARTSRLNDPNRCPGRHRLLVGLLAAGVMSLSACGSDAGEQSSGTAPAAGKTVTVELKTENHSGRSGTAVLKGGHGGLTVTLKVDDASDNYHAHIHEVSCAKYRSMKGFDEQLATVTQELDDLRDGKSETQIGNPLSEYARAGFSINVHEFAFPYPVIACGDFPE